MVEAKNVKKFAKEYKWKWADSGQKRETNILETIVLYKYYEPV